MLRSLLVLALAVHAAGARADPPAGREVEALIAALERSQCEFYRNGSWYGSARAASHLRRKYEYFVDEGLLSSAEDFIARGASASAFSGTPYRVRCAGAAEQPSAQWLTEQLRRERAARGAGS